MLWILRTLNVFLHLLLYFCLLLESCFSQRKLPKDACTDIRLAWLVWLFGWLLWSSLFVFIHKSSKIRYYVIWKLYPFSEDKFFIQVDNSIHYSWHTIFPRYQLQIEFWIEHTLARGTFTTRLVNIVMLFFLINILKKYSSMMSIWIWLIFLKFRLLSSSLMLVM